MPAVTVYYPRNLFDDLHDRLRFMRIIKSSVATHMDAVNPADGEMTKYGDAPDEFIDLLLIPYDSYDASVTALCQATIVTYDWPHRMATIADRIKAITLEVAECVPTDELREGQDRISFTFTGKQPGCWFAA